MSIKADIPEFLVEMSKQIREQGNRCTADPVFEVRYKDYLVTEEGYNEHHTEIVDDDGNTLYHSIIDSDFSILAARIFDTEKEFASSFWNDNGDGRFLDCEESDFINCFNDHFDYTWRDLPDCMRVLYMQEIEVTVNTHLTEAGAQAFINRKQHDYPKLYIYATSLVFCDQMKQLRNWILSLSDD